MSAYRTSPLAAEAPGTVETITRWNGQTYGGRVPAFLGLAQKTGGLFLENPPGSVEEALAATDLNFQVVLEGNQTTIVRPSGVTTLDVPRTRTSVAEWPDGRLAAFGPVGTRYRPIQNPTIAELGQAVVDDHEGSLLAIGGYGDPFGSRVYFAFDLGDFAVGGQDEHNLALTITGAHNGDGGVVVQPAPVRVKCTNQVSGIFGRRFASRFTIRHTESAEGRVQEIREALGLTFRYVERYQAEAEALLAQPIGVDDFVAWEHELFGVDEEAEGTKRAQTILTNRDDELVRIFRGDTNEFGRNTRFAAAQTLIEYLDHVSVVRGKDPEAARWERILAGQTEATKARAWESLLVSA